MEVAQNEGILNGKHESDKFEYPLGGFLCFFWVATFWTHVKWHKLASSRWAAKIWKPFESQNGIARLFISKYQQHFIQIRISTAFHIIQIQGDPLVIGLVFWQNYRNPPTWNHGKNYGFRFRFSLQPIHWFLSVFMFLIITFSTWIVPCCYDLASHVHSIETKAWTHERRQAASFWTFWFWIGFGFGVPPKFGYF